MTPRDEIHDLRLDLASLRLLIDVSLDRSVWDDLMLFEACAQIYVKRRRRLRDLELAASSNPVPVG
jgi:hypothetical protein